MANRTLNQRQGQKQATPVVKAKAPAVIPANRVVAAKKAKVKAPPAAQKVSAPPAATKAKAPANRPTEPPLEESSYGKPLPARTMEERLRCIEVMAERIAGYVRFMCQVPTLGSTSAEAKEKAVSAFYDRMTAAENQLGRIQEELWLG